MKLHEAEEMLQTLRTLAGEWAERDPVRLCVTETSASLIWTPNGLLVQLTVMSDGRTYFHDHNYKLRPNNTFTESVENPTPAQVWDAVRAVMGEDHD